MTKESNKKHDKDKELATIKRLIALQQKSILEAIEKIGLKDLVITGNHTLQLKPNPYSFFNKPLQSGVYENYARHLMKLDNAMSRLNGHQFLAYYPRLKERFVYSLLDKATESIDGLLDFFRKDSTLQHSFNQGNLPNQEATKRFYERHKHIKLAWLKITRQSWSDWEKQQKLFKKYETFFNKSNGLIQTITKTPTTTSSGPDELSASASSPTGQEGPSIDPLKI